MRRFILGLTLLAASPATAEDCPDFALDSAYLHGFFCGQLDQIIGPKTRTIEPDAPVSTPDGLPQEWLGIPAIRDAYRVDPARTLEMIQRIKDAGGEPVQ